VFENRVFEKIFASKTEEVIIFVVAIVVVVVVTNSMEQIPS
jgi:hypothetical protein